VNASNDRLGSGKSQSDPLALTPWSAGVRYQSPRRSPSEERDDLTRKVPTTRLAARDRRRSHPAPSMPVWQSPPSPAADMPPQWLGAAMCPKPTFQKIFSLVKEAKELDKGDRGTSEYGEDRNHLDEPIALDRCEALVRSLLECRSTG
jgi:hypothetical protein